MMFRFEITKEIIRRILPGILGIVLLVGAGCSSTRPYTLEPIKTFDPDTARIERPPEAPAYQWWDRINNTIFHQMEKPLDLNRTFRFIGKAAGIAESRQADNINHLDEPPESSWYTYRDFYKPMTIDQIRRGPNTVPPDTGSRWTIFRAKLSGATSGFFIRDSKGDRYLIKFDGYNYPELATGAGVIGSKIFHAAGYTVPEATIIYFDPDSVVVGDQVMVTEKGETRPMTRDDYLNIIDRRPTNGKGHIRAMASKFVDGVPVGPWYFKGTRDDDPNDRVAHEHRRELRGMRVISSWLNDTDRRDANTLAVYNSKGYIDHYVQDFGNTLGANGSSIHIPIQGQAYMVDPRYMALHAVTLGFFVNSWETREPEVPYPAAGYFRADVFKPGGWVPAHPIPSFENATLRDNYWGAKMVMSFSDRELRAIIEAAEYSNPEVDQYLLEILKERRDMIGRHWFSRINPLDKFHLAREGKHLVLEFTDLGAESGLYNENQVRYRYAIYHDGDRLGGERRAEDSRLDLTDLMGNIEQVNEDLIFNVRIYSEREVMPLDKAVDLYLHIRLDRNIFRIAGIKREE